MRTTKSLDIICNYEFKLFGVVNYLKSIGYRFVKFLLYLFIISNYFVTNAQSNENDFKKINIEIDGEKVFDVSVITQDHQGYIWMETNLGLIRYNGLEGKKYDIKRSDSSSIADDYIRSLYVDYLGDIWIGANSGLSKYNPDCDCLYQYPSKIDNINLTQIRSITEDKNKNIWIGTRNGSLFRYERERDSFTRMLHKPSDSLTIVYDRIYDLLVDQINNLWIGTNSGLVRFNISTGNVKQFLHDPSDPHSLLDNRISALYEDQQEQILIGTFKSGFHIYDPKSELLNRISFDANNPGHIHAPYTEENVFGDDPRVNLIHQDQNGEYWIGTTGKGINHFNARTKTFINYNFNLVNPQILWSIYEDRQGNLWVGGAMGSGLFRTDLFARKYHLNTNFANVLGAYESPLNPGILWIKSQEKGLSKMNLKTNEITRYLHNEDNIKSVGHNWVRSTYQENKGILWVGLGNGGAYGGHDGNGGVDRMDIETGVFTHFKLTRNDDGRDDFSYSVYSICEDNEGSLWLGAGPGGIFRSDKDKKKFKHFKILKNDNLSRNVFLNVVRIDSNGDIWASDFAGEGTLYLYDRQEDKFSPYLKGFKMYNLLIDDKGWLLIGTWEKGLVHLNPVDRTYIQYTKKEGLPSNEGIIDIAKGENGIFWVNTRVGPAKFDTETGKISPVGLPKLRYGTRIFKASDNQIYLGASNGLSSFYPDQVLGNPFPPQLKISDLLISEKNYLANKNESDELNLSYNQNDISFKYVGLHFSNPEKNLYQYKLSPLNENWLNVGTERTARFFNLSPGSYNFQVKAANSDGVWSNKTDSVQFTINPPWWGTWWAYTIYLFVTIITIYGIRKYELNRIQLKNKLKLEHVASEKLRELDQAKSRFFANISHEFRTPLTLILGQISNTLSNKLDSKIKSNLEVANRNAQRLLHLINQLLDLSKIESGSMSVKSKRADIVLFIKNIFYSFESLAKQREITYNCNCNYNRIELDYDPRKLEKVFYNLLSNAFKFTPVGGKIEVTIKHIFNSTTLNITDINDVDSKSGIIEILVADTGSGVSAENIPHLFNRFYQVDNSTTREHQGTGIGLALSKELVELHGGKISVASEVGVGSTFIVQLPFEDCNLVHDKPQKTEPKLSEQTNGYEEIKHDSLTVVDKDLSSAKTSNIKKNGKEIILVVEDNIDVRNYIVEQLTNDFQIFEAEDGQEGIYLAKTHTPDLIITDVMMPKIDGCQLTTELKQDEKTSHIPIVMLTAKATINNKIEGFEIGADDYILKPFNSEELLVRVKNLIATRRQLRKKFSKATIIKPSDVTAVSMDQLFLQKVLNVVDKHFEDEQFGVDKLAEESNMSVSQLNRKLGALIDQPAGQLIRSMRLQRAADLLKKDSGTIAEICYQVGFNDQTSFTRAFKKQFGDPPSKYKIKVKKNNDKPLLG